MNSRLFARRRETFLQLIDPDGVVILPGNQLVARNLDTPYPFRQYSDFYYLTGYEEPGAIAVMVPGSQRYRFVLFVHRPTEREILYDGRTSDRQFIQQHYGASRVYFTEQFEAVIQRIVRRDRPIYYPYGWQPQWDAVIQKLFLSRRSGGLWPLIDPLPIIHRMRRIKHGTDLQAGLLQAVAITSEGLQAGIRSVQPGRWEYQVQATIEATFLNQGAQRLAFQSIIASGPNSGILHYVRNNRQMQAGEVVLMDCGAEYQYYCGDLTRTVPVNGTFSRAQREIYTLVLHALKTGITACRPGTTRKEVTRQMDAVLQEGLQRLGLIERPGDFKHYTIHGYIHWLGMDVHDVGGYTHEGEDIPFEPGMVMTVEPGIYIREDVLSRLQKARVPQDQLERIAKKIQKYLNIGIRIEDNIVITEKGNQVLSANLPREIEDIEAIMKR